MSSKEGQVEAILLMAGFTEVDINNDGYLTVEELRNALKNTELEKFVDLIVLKADADQNGKIDYRGKVFELKATKSRFLVDFSLQNSVKMWFLI